MALVTSKRYPNWQGNLLIGALAFQHVARVQLSGAKYNTEEKLMQNLGRFRHVAQSPDGYLYAVHRRPRPTGEADAERTVKTGDVRHKTGRHNTGPHSVSVLSLLSYVYLLFAGRVDHLLQQVGGLGTGLDEAARAAYLVAGLPVLLQVVEHVGLQARLLAWSGS
jgi:hypothetical protein